MSLYVKFWPSNPVWCLLYLVNLVKKRQLVNILIVRLGNSHLRWQSQNINWKFLAISRTASLLARDTKWDRDTFCEARTAFSKRIVKFSVIAMSFVDRCCSYSLKNSSKSVKNKLHWLFISFWSTCVTMITMLKLRSLWSWCWEKIVELKIKLLKLTGKQCWRWDRFVELGITLLVLIQIFINVVFCYNLATINVWLATKPLGVFSSETKWLNASLLFVRMNYVKSV